MADPTKDTQEPNPWELIERYERFMEWLIALDNPDPESQGYQQRRTVSLNLIIKKARVTLGVD